jgi:hypothetical protein
MAYSVTLVFEAPTGLTLEGLLLDTTGSAVGSAVATGFHEEASSGWYMWTGAVPDGHQGCVVFRTSGGGTVHALREINPAQYENVDVKLSEGVPLDLDQVVPFEDLTPKTTQTVGDCLSAARAGAAGKMTIASGIQTLYGPDATTTVRRFELDDPVWPTSRV